MNVIDSIPVGNVPMIPAITPDGAMVFVTNRNSSSVTAITTATRKPAFTVSDIGVEPHGIAVSKDGKYVYVSCENLGIGEPPHHATSGGKNPSFLKVIDIGKRSVVASIELGNFGSGMAVTQ
jgi:YVTN family beta-propeller protein